MSFLFAKKQPVAPELDGDDAARRRTAWRRALAGLAVGLTVVFVLYFDAIASAVSVWNASAAHQFSYLVIPLSAYFVWLRRADLSGMAPQPSPRGLFIAIPFAILWLVSQAAQLSVGMQLATMGMMQIAFLTILGWPLYRVLLFPLLFLWLLVPFGDFLIPKLTDLTTVLTVAGLRLSGLQVESLGSSLITSAARYEIVEECSAFDFLVGNLVISLVFANLIYRGVARRVAYVLASVPVAILANNLRTTSIVLITELTDSRINLVSDHRTYGWIVFFIAVAAQMAVGLRYRDSAGESGRAPHTIVAAASTSPPMARLALVVCGFVLAVLIAPAYSALVVDRPASPVATQFCFPPGFAIGRPVPDGAGNWRPVIPAAHARLHRVLEVDGRTIDLFVAYFWRQGPGAELIGWGNRLYDGKTWRAISGGRETIHVDGQSLQADSTRLYGPSGKRRIVWSWYWVDGQMTARPWYAKLMQAMAVLLGGDKRAALVTISADAQGGHDAVRRAMQAALKRNPVIGDMLRGVTAIGPTGRLC